MIGLALAAALLTAQVLTPQEAGGTADIAVQGYYLGGNSQPLTALSGLSISFREYLPALGLVTGNLEGYEDSAHGRIGQNSVTVHGLKWKGRRWTITGGDFFFRTALIPSPFTNYAYPELGARGAMVEMLDGHRRVTLFWGEETLQSGPRITFRTRVPQSVLGVSIEQSFGARLHVAARYLGLSSGETSVAENPFYFPEGSEFRRTDSLDVQAAYSAGRGLTLWSDVTLSHEQFASTAAYTRTAPLSSITGARWQTKRLTVAANYGSLSRSALPVLGFFFGDRKGPFAEVRYKVFRSFEFYGSAVRSQNNLEKNPTLISLTTQDLTAGANVTLPGNFGISGQYSKIGLWGQLPSDASQNQSQRSSQAQMSLNKSFRHNSVLVTGRDLNLASLALNQKIRSAEVQNNVQFSGFLMGAAVRMQQQSSAGQLQNSVFVRASGQIRLGRFSVYGQFEKGNDLINKTLFAVTTVNTTVAGVQIPVVHGWSVNAEAFRTTLLAALNPASILVLQTQATGVSDILNNFNQWSFFLRLNHRTHWGSPLPEPEALGNQVIYGSIEGFVFDDATGTNGAGGISVQLDKSRFATTDATGRYRFDDVPEGLHAVALNTTELPAEYSPGPVSGGSVTVKPRGIARQDLRVVKAGSSIRGVLTGLATEDLGTVRLENIVISLSSGSYTTCDSTGQFGFYNLAAGQYSVSVDPTSLPENYVVVSTRGAHGGSDFRRRCASDGLSNREAREGTAGAQSIQRRRQLRVLRNLKALGNRIEPLNERSDVDARRRRHKDMRLDVRAHQPQHVFLHRVAVGICELGHVTQRRPPRYGSPLNAAAANVVVRQFIVLLPLFDLGFHEPAQRNVGIGGTRRFQRILIIQRNPQPRIHFPDRERGLMVAPAVPGQQNPTFRQLKG